MSFATRVLGASLLSLGIACGPIGPLSGGRLSGDEGAWPPDWSAAADEAQAQLETRPEDPHSINIWFVVVDDQAFVATSLLLGPEVPEEREWVRNVDLDPRVRLRLKGVVYPARLEVLEDPELRNRAMDAFRAKYPELDPERGSGARFFRVAARNGSGS